MKKHLTTQDMIDHVAEQERINPDPDPDFDREFNDLPIDPGSFAAAYKKAKDEGRLKKRTYQIHSWADDGEELIGKIISVRPFEGGKFEGSCLQYLMETDQGRRSFILGAYTDEQLKSEPIENRVVRVYYSGRKDLEDGRKVNLFDIEVLD